MATVDLSPMFPDYDSADGEVDDNKEIVSVRLHSGGTFSTIRLALNSIYQCLDHLRKSVR